MAKRGSLWSFKKKYNCPRNENKGSNENKAGRVVRRPALSEDQRSSRTEFIFFGARLSIHTKDSNELAEYEKEKKKRKKDEGRRESVS